MQAIDNYTFEEEQQIVKSATRRKELKRLDQVIKEKHFRIRNKSIQHYFIRMSGGHKINFIIRLMEKVTDLSSFWQLVHIMSLQHTKMVLYTSVDPETNFIYDKLVLDHDRMLDEKVLSETIDNDTAWFATLEDSYKVNLITDLIRISAGPVKRKLYMPIFRFYYKKLGEFLKHQRRKPAGESMYNQSYHPDNILLEDEEDYDPKHPATIEVEKQRNKWDEMISKYRSEVRACCKICNATAPNDQNTEKKDEMTKKKGKKLEKADATVKTKTKSDNTKKTKSAKEAEDEQIYLFELLPIWIVKKIFGYLDQKTLLSLKNLNSYCSYVVQEILKERKARESINKYLANLEAQIDPEKLKSVKRSSSDKPTCKVQKRPHGIYYELGAIPKKLVPQQKKNLVDTCLISETEKEFADEFALPTGELVSFPRLIEQDIQLYRHLPCFLQDVNVIYDIEGDIQRQRSFLTYSLTSVVSSLKILVNEQDLSDW